MAIWFHSKPTNSAAAKGLVQETLTAPGDVPTKTIQYAADSAAPEMFNVDYTHGNEPTPSGKRLRLTFWLNERGLLRLMQSTYTKWDVPFRIFGPSDNTGFGSNIMEAVRARPATGPNPAPIYAIAPSGHLRTSLYVQDAVVFDGDPKFSDGSGQSGGPWGPPRARREADDRVYLSGRIACSSTTIAVGDIIGTLPAAYRPTVNRTVMIGNSSGGVAHTHIQTNGQMINARNSSNAGSLYLDGVSYTL